MFLKLGRMSIWPSRDIIKQIMPESIREKFPSVRCIIDCLEIFTETPSSLPLHKVMFSEYKHNTTWKCLVGIAPGGGFTFVSSLFLGRTSDKEIVSKSGILHPRLWEKGDAIMADRGFTIQTYWAFWNWTYSTCLFRWQRSTFRRRNYIDSTNSKWEDTCWANDTMVKIFSHLWFWNSRQYVWLNKPVGHCLCNVV